MRSISSTNLPTQGIIFNVRDRENILDQLGIDESRDQVDGHGDIKTVKFSDNDMHMIPYKDNNNRSDGSEFAFQNDRGDNINDDRSK
jgi:hypothetical protein